ncbi:hypothetical protein LCGC14_2363730 [marine sediment metagenome]|uniref:Uncharacterized protein n=1 Tax=marine sediment metagenome TaxID=412755 RepID=A0A0F9C5Q9_9ZZZZ
MNLPILEQIIREQVGADTTAARDKATMEMAHQLKNSELFAHMNAGCLAALFEHPKYPEAAMMSVLTYTLYIGIIYAKAEREVAELEKLNG